jgi:parvulin-like peptidyl-prolyl isomerase
MTGSRTALLAFLLFALLLAACGEATPTETILKPIVSPSPLALTPGAPAATGAAQPTHAALPEAQQAYCKNGGAVTASPNEPLAAQVNGQPILLALYQRQAQQAQNTLVAQGLDPKSKQGQDALKGLQQQVLGQLIDDVIIEQSAQAQHVSITAQDVNNRIQQMIDDAGGRDKFDSYLNKTQTTLDDLCTQIRASLFGDAMLNRVTAGMPTRVEQVHAAQILLASQTDADNVLAQLKAGKDFAELAKQYSKDELTRAQGGDLGWFPRGIYPAQLDAVAFSLQPGQISDVIQTPLGFHIIKVLEHATSRELDPMTLQSQKQQAFYAWLDAERSKAKIEKFINP